MHFAGWERDGIIASFLKVSSTEVPKPHELTGRWSRPNMSYDDVNVVHGWLPLFERSILCDCLL